MKSFASFGIGSLGSISIQHTSATATLPPRATGYFVVKHDGVRLRLDPLTPASPD